MKPKLKITGQKELLKKLAAFGEEAERKISLTTFGTAGQIADDATQAAPANNGDLRQSINLNPNAPGKLFYEVNVNAPYAGFVEFGTGTKVSVPAEMEDIARGFQYGKKGKFSDMIESLKEWCRKKGIPEQAVWPIAMNILKYGLEPKPFLYPAYRKGVAGYDRALEKLLTDLTNKFNR